MSAGKGDKRRPGAGYADNWGTIFGKASEPVPKDDPAHVIEVLETHNRWRRGDETVDMIHPETVGKAIDAAVKLLKELKT